MTSSGEQQQQSSVDYFYNCVNKNEAAVACATDCVGLEDCQSCECSVLPAEAIRGPWGSVVDVLFCLAPIFFLIFVTVKKKNPWNTTASLPATAVLMFLVRVLYLGSDPNLVFSAIFLGFHEALTPLAIMIGAITLFETMEATYCMPYMMREMKALTSGNPVAEIMLMFGFATMIEGAAAFGTPVALGAPMLVSTGHAMIESVILMLLFSNFSKVWGAVGTPIWYGFGSLGLTEQEYLEISHQAAICLNIASIILVPWIVTILVPWKIVKGDIVFILLSTFATAAPSILIAYFSYEFPPLLGGLFGSLATAVLIKYNIGLKPFQKEEEKEIGRTFHSRALERKLSSKRLTGFASHRSLTGGGSGASGGLSHKQQNPEKDNDKNNQPKRVEGGSPTSELSQEHNGDDNDCAEKIDSIVLKEEEMPEQPSNTKLAAAATTTGLSKEAEEGDDNDDEVVNVDDALPAPSSSRRGLSVSFRPETMEDDGSDDDDDDEKDTAVPRETAGLRLRHRPSLQAFGRQSGSRRLDTLLEELFHVRNDFVGHETEVDDELGPRKSWGEGYVREVLLRTFPLWGVVLMLLLTRIQQIGLKGYLVMKEPYFQIHFGSYGDFRLSASLVFQFRNILQYPNMNWKFELLYIPFVLPFIAISAATMLMYRKNMKSTPFEIASTVKRRLENPTIAMMGALVLVQLVLRADTAAPAYILGINFANWFQKGFIAISPILGALGALFAGSTTVSNLTFGGVQLIAADNIGVSRTALLALQTVGSSAGISLNNIISACAVLGLKGQEGMILLECSKFVFSITTISTLVMLAVFIRF